MRAKRSALSQQVTKRHQQTDVHESRTKQDRNNINDPQKKHRLGTVSKNMLLEDVNRSHGAPTSPLVQMWIKTHRCLVFDRSIQIGKLLADWCRVYVTPFFKEGDKSLAANYRPIYLTFILCKVLKHNIASQVVKHFYMTSNTRL